MSDIVERLRQRANGEDNPVNEMLFVQAADTIERLRAEVDDWRGRFKAIVGFDSPSEAGNCVLALLEKEKRLRTELAELLDVGDRMRDALHGTRHDAGLGTVWDAARREGE